MPDLILVCTKRITNSREGLEEDASYSCAIERNPDAARAYNQRGLAYIALDEYEQAISDLDRAIELNPEYVEAYSNRGEAYYLLGEYEQALDDVNHAIELESHSAAFFINRANIHTSSGNYDHAIANYNNAVRLEPDNPTTYLGRGRFYSFTERYEQAIADFNRALELDPDFAEAYNQRGVVYAKQSRYQQAVTDFDRAIEVLGMLGSASMSTLTLTSITLSSLTLNIPGPTQGLASHIISRVFMKSHSKTCDGIYGYGHLRKSCKVSREAHTWVRPYKCVHLRAVDKLAQTDNLLNAGVIPNIPRAIMRTIFVVSSVQRI